MVFMKNMGGSHGMGNTPIGSDLCERELKRLPH